MRRRIHFLGALAAVLLTTSGVEALAQDQEEPTKRATIRSATVSAQPAQPKPAAGTQLAAPDPDGLRHICNSGNCACAGVQDCVDMKDICAPGTMGCNQHGCTCKEADSGGDGG